MKQSSSFIKCSLSPNSREAAREHTAALLILHLVPMASSPFPHMTFKARETTGYTSASREHWMPGGVSLRLLLWGPIPSPQWCPQAYMALAVAQGRLPSPLQLHAPP